MVDINKNKMLKNYQYLKKNLIQKNLSTKHRFKQGSKVFKNKKFN